MTGSKNIRLGVFVFVGTILFIIGIFALGEKSALFSDTFSVHTYFTNIEGLRQGASVRLSGINVGSVSSISLTPDTSGRVLVKLNLVEEVNGIIRTNTKALIETEGLVGSKVLVLQPGNINEGQLAKNGDEIIAVNPVGMGVIIDEMTEIMHDTKSMTKNLAEIIEKVNNGDGTIAKLLNDDELYQNTTDVVKAAEISLVSITHQMDSLANLFTNIGQGTFSIIASVDSVIQDVDEILSNIEEGEGFLGMMVAEDGEFETTFSIMLDNVVKTTEEIKLGASRFSENMEALKRNWLFKSYFEERGYYDKSSYEMELDDYLKKINERIKVLDERIEELRSLEK